MALTELIRSVVGLFQIGRACPAIAPVNRYNRPYDKRSATFYRNKISLSTVNGRIECEFELPAGSPTPYEEYVLSEDYEFRTSTRQYEQATDEFYFHVTTRKVDDESEPVEVEGSDDTGHQTVLGIDLGVNSLAVSSTGTFWSGDEYDHWIHEFEKRRAELQQRGTQAAHNALLRLGKRERAWRKQYIHTVANEIVAEAVDHDCDVIVFEDLTDIRIIVSLFRIDRPTAGGRTGKSLQ